jgi:hypothetical protein
MFSPDQSLDIDLSPTQLRALDHFVARLADARLGLLLGLGFAMAPTRCFTPW